MGKKGADPDDVIQFVERYGSELFLGMNGSRTECVRTKTNPIQI
jgi:hypothetical protein